MTRYKEEKQFGKSLGFFQYKSKWVVWIYFPCTQLFIQSNQIGSFYYPLYYLPGITPSLCT
jgi:hypothetical protein